MTTTSVADEPVKKAEPKPVQVPAPEREREKSRQREVGWSTVGKVVVVVALVAIAATLRGSSFGLAGELGAFAALAGRVRERAAPALPAHGRCDIPARRSFSSRRASALACRR